MYSNTLNTIDLIILNTIGRKCDVIKKTKIQNFQDLLH